MLIMILGLLLWWGAHFWKRAAPASRTRFGDAGKGIVTGVLLLSVVLMVIGYKMADGPYWWGATPMLKGINNVMVLIAFYLFAASGMKTGITRHLRHPQLTAFALWAAGHVLVNGDLPSLVLFGGLMLWAVAEIAVLNSIAPRWTPPAHPVPIRKEGVAVVAALVAFAVVGLIHGWIGPSPFGA